MSIRRFFLRVRRVHEPGAGRGGGGPPEATHQEASQANYAQGMSDIGFNNVCRLKSIKILKLDLFVINAMITLVISCFEKRPRRVKLLDF